LVYNGVLIRRDGEQRAFVAKSEKAAEKASEKTQKSAAPAARGKPAKGAGVGVAVVGSLNMDLVVRTEAMPLPGQSVMGQDLHQNPGGKGANQAVAAGKLMHRKGMRAGAGGGCRMIGRVGDDLFGQQLVKAIGESHVDVSGIMTTRHAPSGVAMIVVDRHGENAIVVSGGSNQRLSPEDLLAQRKGIEASKVLICQLETPADTVATAIALAKQAGVLTILDPAPAPIEGLSESLYHVDFLLPNQLEAQALSGVQVRTADDARRAAEKMLMRGTKTVIVKMGSQGAVIVRMQNGKAEPTLVSGYRVQVVDTTGAGDAFAGGLAVGLSEGMELEAAVKFANAAGAIACTKRGAGAAMPTREEVEALMAPKIVEPKAKPEEKK
jgi:ribokinase